MSVTYRKCSASEPLGQSANYRVTFAQTWSLVQLDSDFMVQMRRTFDAIAGTSLAFPTHNLAVTDGETTAVVDVRVATGAESQLVSDLVNALQRLHPSTEVTAIERIGAPSVATLAQLPARRDAAQQQAAEAEEADGIGAQFERLMREARWLLVAIAAVVLVGLYAKSKV